MSGKFELTLKMVIFIFKDLCFLEYFFGFNFVFLIAYFLIEPILLESQRVQMFDYLLHLSIPVLSLFFKLKLCVEQLII